MQLRINALNVEHLHQYTLRTTAGASGTVAAYFIYFNGDRPSLNLNIYTTQSSLTQLYRDTIGDQSAYLPDDSCIVITFASSAYIGNAGSPNGTVYNYSPSTPTPPEILVAPGKYLLKCNANPESKMAERIYRNLESVPLADTPQVLVVGSDGTNTVPLKVNSSGFLNSNFPFTASAAGSNAVTTTVMRVLGATSAGTGWLGATTNGASNRVIDVCNCSASLDAYVSYVAVGSSLTSAVSSTDYIRKLGPGETYSFVVEAGLDLCVVRSATSTDNVRAREHLYT